MTRATFLFIGLILCASFLHAQAQDRLPVREYTSPEEIISMTGDTPFSKAMGIFSNAFKRFAQKPLVYEDVDKVGPGYVKTVSINIPNMYWREAFDLVLRVNNYWYTESPDYVRVYPLSTKPDTGMSAKEGMQTREVEISAIFFEANRSEMEQLGIDWTFTNTAGSATTKVGVVNVGTFPGETGSGSGSGTGGSGSGSNQNTSIEYGMMGSLHAYPTSATDLLAMLKAIQSENLGELISSPSISVRSGEVGRIQVGQDFSVKQRDFSGNTVDKFYSAGTIIDVTPTIMKKDSVEFVHLKIKAERSSVIPDPVSTLINKTEANTSVLLIDGEETVVGGLFTNDVQKVRRGIPFLKDLPWWVLGLRYLFGYDEDKVTKKELIIILKAKIAPSIEDRVARKVAEIHQGQRALQREWERQENSRKFLEEQIEAAKKNRQ